MKEASIQRQLAVTQDDKTGFEDCAIDWQDLARLGALEMMGLLQDEFVNSVISMKDAKRFLN